MFCEERKRGTSRTARHRTWRHARLRVPLQHGRDSCRVQLGRDSCRLPVQLGRIPVGYNSAVLAVGRDCCRFDELRALHCKSTSALARRIS